MTRRHSIIVAVLAVATLVGVATPAAQAETSTDARTSGDLVQLVVTRGPVDDAAVRDTVADHDGVVVNAIEAIDRVVVEAPAPTDALEAALVDLGVDGIAPARVARAAQTEPDSPDDPLWSEQWGLREARVPYVWSRTTGESDTVVAVLDTGVDAAVAELGDRLRAGVDLVDGDGDPADENGHGTAVAAVIAATTDEVGITGGCPGCSVLPVRVLDDFGFGTSATVADGIVAAVDHGADVVNVSAIISAQDDTVDAAVDYATDADVLVIASAGNQGDTNEQWPGAHPDVIAVAGHDEAGDRHEASSYGPWVEVAAAFCTPVPRADGYFEACGTSFSSPVVAGLAGLLQSARPDAPAVVLRERLLVAADSAALAWTAHGRAVGDLALDRLDRAVAEATTCPAKVADDGGFSDVSPDSVHAGSVACSSWWGFLTGRADDRFEPSMSLTRGQVASILARVIGETDLTLPVGTDQFSDDDGSVHESSINSLSELGVVAGTGPGTYLPNGAVTRAQLASLVVRTLELLADAELPAGTDRFSDDDGSVHEPAINAAAEAGLVQGVGDGTFAPVTPVRRDQSASILMGAAEHLVEGQDLVAPDRR